MRREVVAAGVGWADPVPVPDAHVLVGGEQPPHWAALVPDGAAGTGPSREEAQRRPVWYPQPGQRPDQRFARGPGDRRKRPTQRPPPLDRLTRAGAGAEQ